MLDLLAQTKSRPDFSGRPHAVVPPELTRLASTRCAANGALSGRFYSSFFRQLGVDGPLHACATSVRGARDFEKHPGTSVIELRANRKAAR